MKIILDTNFLFLPIREGIDLVKELKTGFEGKKEIIILKDSLIELEKLHKKGIRDAKLALENVLKQKLKVLDIPGVKDVDEKILRYAIKQNAFIATNDKLLRESAKTKGVSVIAYNKSKKRIIKV